MANEADLLLGPGGRRRALGLVAKLGKGLPIRPESRLVVGAQMSASETANSSNAPLDILCPRHNSRVPSRKRLAVRARANTASGRGRASKRKSAIVHKPRTPRRPPQTTASRGEAGGFQRGAQVRVREHRAIEARRESLHQCHTTRSRSYNNALNKEPAALLSRWQPAGFFLAEERIPVARDQRIPDVAQRAWDEPQNGCCSRQKPPRPRRTRRTADDLRCVPSRSISTTVFRSRTSAAFNQWRAVSPCRGAKRNTLRASRRMTKSTKRLHSLQTSSKRSRGADARRSIPGRHQGYVGRPCGRAGVSNGRFDIGHG